MVVHEIVRQALQVTAFVAVMMLAVEYVNVSTRGAWPANLAASPWKQYLIAVLLGATPGCMGAFAIVALYTHRMVSFGALAACMIATSGDESFVMLALFPGTAVALSIGLAAVGWVVGALTDLLIKPPRVARDDHGFALHEYDDCRCFPSRDEMLGQLRHPSLARGVLLLAQSCFLAAVISGGLGPPTWNWMRVTLLIVGGFVMFIVLTVPEHFLEAHLWQHAVLQHVPRIFLWTLGALAAVALLERIAPESPLGGLGRWWALVAASLLGIVPESGPHLIVVTLFDRGLLPLSTLVASSIVQDGHGMLPLLAESRLGFLRVKGINLLAGVVVGALLMAMGL